MPSIPDKSFATIPSMSQKISRYNPFETRCRKLRGGGQRGEAEVRRPGADQPPAPGAEEVARTRAGRGHPVSL